MSQENVAVIRGVRTPVAVSTETRRRSMNGYFIRCCRALTCRKPGNSLHRNLGAASCGTAAGTHRRKEERTWRTDFWGPT